MRALRKHSMELCPSVDPALRDQSRGTIVAGLGTAGNLAMIPTATRTSSDACKRKRQTTLTGGSHITADKVTKAMADIFDRKLLLMIVMCGLSFHMVDNHWFLDLIWALAPNYKPAGLHMPSACLQLLCPLMPAYDCLAGVQGDPVCQRLCWTVSTRS